MTPPSRLSGTGSPLRRCALALALGLVVVLAPNAASAAVAAQNTPALATPSDPTLLSLQPRRQVLAAELRQAMDQIEPGEMLGVYVVMADQIPGQELQQRVAQQMKALAEEVAVGDKTGAGASALKGAAGNRTRRRLVSAELKAHATATQVQVRAQVEAAEQAGQAQLLDVLWMGNALLLKARPPVLELLAAIPGIDRIRLLPDTPAERAQDALPPSTLPGPQVAPPLKAPKGARAILHGPMAPKPGTGLYPFMDDFESGTLEGHWTVETTGGGYALVTTDEEPVGAWHVVMATSTNSLDSTASLTVELDLAGQTDVGIRFRHKEFGDENHPEDGVFVSTDGVTWHEVISLQNADREYVWKYVTLDPLLAGFGIGFTSNFRVRFQWRDNFDIPSDGFGFDDIEIAPGVGVKPPPEVEPHLIALQAPDLWEMGFRGAGVLIGNIDSGSDWQHPDLINRVWTNPGEIPSNSVDDDGNGFVDDIHGWDFEFGGANVTSTDPHGTHTAGLMVGDGSDGRITGMAPEASFAICEVSTESQYWQAQQYMLDQGVDVISSSYSYKWPDGPDYHMFRQLCDVELAAGIIHANSIGNQGVLLATHPIPFNISTPGNCPTPFAHPDGLGGGRSSIMACGGIELPDDTHYNPSGRGPSAWEDITLYDPTYPHTQDPAAWDYPVGGFGGNLPGLIKPDVMTYTNSVMTTNLGSGYTLFSGTSAATPQLGGAMALLRNVQPNAQPRHIAAALELSAVDLGAPGKDNIYGSGKVQVFDAARRLRVLSSFSINAASPGQAFDLDVFGLPNTVAYGFYQASLVTTLGELNLPLPLFFLGIRFLDAQGEGTWNLAVPNDPGLIGLTVWFQAASEAPDGTWGAGPFLSVPDSLTVIP